MYTTLLFIHSWLRWIFLLVAVIVIVKSFIGWMGNKEYAKADNALAGSFLGIMHLQFLLGIILYIFLSPITEAAFQNFGAAMKNPAMRYWAVEHISIMIIALVIAQIGRIKAKKAVDALKKFKLQAIFFTVALILILSRIPFDQSERMFRF